jgi:hypothetical protein
MAEQRPLSHRNISVPTVAVCIPTIPPREHLLRRAMISVGQQTHQPDQVIVQTDDDGQGAGPTRNQTWQQARTQYVAFLDDDDEFMPTHLADCLAYAAVHDADLVFSWFELVGWADATPERPDALATMCHGQLVHPLGVPFGPEQEAHYRKHAFIPITTVVRRSLLEETGGYPTPGTSEWPLPDCEDWGGHLRFLDAGARFVHLPKRTWVCHHDPATSTAGRPWQDTYQR